MQGGRGGGGAPPSAGLMQSLREAEEAKAGAMMRQRCIKIDTAGCVFPQVGPPSLPPSLPPLPPRIHRCTAGCAFLPVIAAPSREPRAPFASASSQARLTNAWPF